MPKIIGYTRISTDTQDLAKQKHLLLEYAQQNKIMIDEFIEVEISSIKSTKDRRIDELLTRLNPEDTLIVAELSRLGRNMLQTLGIINGLTERGIKIIFVRQPELSVVGSSSKLLLAIYSYFAEAERDYISMRTKQGLQALKDRGIKLGRPVGSGGKSVLDKDKDEIVKMVSYGSPQTTIAKRFKVSNGTVSTFLKLQKIKYIK
jgi:DNA invertase Pin-like site-specific DNA recombinase